MADFCAFGTRQGDPGNDFAGWLGGTAGHEWGLCEGCGTHLFDDAGEPVCAPGETPAPPRGALRCPQCRGWAFTARLVEPGMPIPYALTDLDAEIVAQHGEEVISHG